MKIIEIKRLVSDGNYNNMEATAEITEDCDLKKAAIELDRLVKEMLAAIDDHQEYIRDFKRKKTEAVDILKDALEHATKCQVPF